MSPAWSARASRPAYLVCVVLACLIACLVVLVVLLRLDGSYARSHSLASGVPDLLIMASFAVVGVFAVLKRPANLVGWALVLAGAGLLAGGVLGTYAELALLAKPEAGLPAGAAAEAVSGGAWTPLMAGVFLLLLVFPLGTLPTPALRRFAVLVLLGFAVVWTIIATAPGTFDPPFAAYRNPLAVTTSRSYIVAMVPVIAACLLSVLAAGVIALRRFRRSRDQERQQFKWLAASAGLLVVTLPIGAAFNSLPIVSSVFTAELIALPVSVGVAILRYRLYEIDVIIRRTLIYGALLVVLAVVYLGGVYLLGGALRSITGGSGTLAVTLSTLAVAGAFQPLRGRIQRIVDHRFYRRKYDAARTLELFGGRLREQIDLSVLQQEMLATVRATVQPRGATLWLRDDRGRV